MISTTQLEAFWERYQREGVPNDLSMQAFCSMHNVPYNCFERYVRQRGKFSNIKPVTITDIPGPEHTQVEATGTGMGEKRNQVSEQVPERSVRILVTIKMSNGFQIHRSNIDYRTLVELVEKMEALC